MLTRRTASFAAAAIVLIFLTSCWGGGPRDPAGLDSIRQGIAQLRADLAEFSRTVSNDAETRFTLQLLHASDMDGSTGALGNVENFSAILSALRAQFPDNTLVLSSGDNYIPGPRYYAAADDAKCGHAGDPRQRAG